MGAIAFGRLFGPVLELGLERCIAYDCSVRKVTSISLNKFVHLRYVWHYIYLSKLDVLIL